MKDVRSWLMPPATTLPSALVSVTRWNQPSRTSTRTCDVGTTSEAAFFGVKVSDGLDGAGAASDGAFDLPLHAASTPGATTPTANAVRARRLFRCGGVGSTVGPGLTCS